MNFILARNNNFNRHNYNFFVLVSVYPSNGQFNVDNVRVQKIMVRLALTFIFFFNFLKCMVRKIITHKCLFYAPWESLCAYISTRNEDKDCALI